MIKWLKYNKQFIIATVIFSIFGTGVAFGLPYIPSDAMLDPTCAPGDANCYVSFMIGYGAGHITSNLAVGDNSLIANTTGLGNTATGYNTLASNTTGQYNSAFGYQALKNNTTGNLNTAIGKETLYNNTTGGWNLAAGYGAMYNNTTGYENTAVGGFLPMLNNTTGLRNVAVGTYALVQNTTGSYNTVVGNDANSQGTATNYNVAVGYQALRNNTVDSNTAVGYQALKANTTGANNTALGYSALNSNTTGDYNTALGTDALQSNTTGYSNSAFGRLALGSNTTGFNNMAFGHTALWLMEEGIGNVGVGLDAIRHATSGNYNVAIGTGSLYGNQAVSPSGDFNVGIGYSTMEDYTTASSNVAIGSVAGQKITTGSYNTFIGERSGRGNTTGSNNTLLGYRSGYSDPVIAYANNIFLGYQAGDNITTGADNNIIIGYDIDLPTANGDNQMSIGNLIFGTGVDGSGTTVSTGNIGIGDSTPAAKFTVGDGDLFQVNSSGAIAAATGITTSGTVILSTTPTSSAGTYNILTRDTTTGNVEKITALPNNMLENSSFTFGAGSTGTDVNWSGGFSLGGTITLNIPDASTSARGLITTGTQTFTGTKTFTTTSGTNYFKINTSGANTGYGAVAVEGDTPSTNLVFLSGSSAMAGTLFGVNRALSAQFYSNNQPIVMGTAAAYDFTLGTNQTANLTIKSGGNVGIGDITPASMFTVGASDAFQVNSSGAIAAATGITSSGIFSLTAGTSTDSFIDLTSTGDFLIKDNNNTFVTFRDTGRVGIGTGATAPAEALLIKDADSTQTKLLIENTSTTGTPDITLYNANGGSNTNYTKYFINGSSGGYNEMSLGATGQAGFTTGAAVTNFVINTYNGNIVFGTNSSAAGVERMRISTGGLVSIGGDTTPDYKLDVDTDIASSYVAGFFNDGNNDNRWGIVIQAGADTPSANRWIQFNDGDGTDQGSICYTGGQANICAPSDIRLKKDIVDTSIGLNSLLNIKVRDFVYISDGENRVVHGFIAQELVDIYPDAVSKPTDPNEMWKVSYNQLTPLIIKSIQDLDLKVNDLSSLDTAKENSLASRIKIFLSDVGNGIEVFYTKLINADKVQTKELCVGNVCVTEDQFLQIVNQSGITPTSNPAPDSTSTPDPTPDSTPILDSTSDPAPTPDSVSTPDPAPTPDSVSTPDPAPSVDPAI